MLKENKSETAAKEMIEKVIVNVLEEKTTRERKKTKQIEDGIASVEVSHMEGFLQISENGKGDIKLPDLKKGLGITEPRKRNRCLTNGSLKSDGNLVQYKGALKERSRMKMGNSYS